VKRAQPASVIYDGLDHAAVQMLVDHVDGSGVRCEFEIAPNGHTFVYVLCGEAAYPVNVMLWPGCVVTRDERNQITVGEEADGEGGTPGEGREAG
jgi:hypothetical protein